MAVAKEQRAASPPAHFLALASLLLAGPALADDTAAAPVQAAEEAFAAASDAAASASVVAPSGAGWVLALSPLIYYGIFSAYRSQVNPKAKLGDWVFGAAGEWGIGCLEQPLSGGLGVRSRR